jgi:hypothetical protein
MHVCALIGFFLALATMPHTADAADAADDDEWHFDLAPYVWIPDLEVDLRFANDLPPGGSTSADVQGGPNQLDGVLLLNMAARKGDWSLAGDFIYLGYTIPSSVTRVNGGNGDAALVPRTANLGTDTKVETTLLQLALGHSLPSSPLGDAEAFAGLRYVDITGRLRWDFSQDITGTDFTFARSGEIEADATYLDGIVGLRGRRNVGGEQWFVTYYADVGAGDSDLTWQANVGAGYAFDWGDCVLAYRYLDYDEGSDAFLQAMRVKGPLFGVVFHF